MMHFNSIQSLSNFYNIDTKHPLIDIQKYEDIVTKPTMKLDAISLDFYKIAFINNFNGFFQIGDTRFEGNNGVLHFLEPGQVYSCNSTNRWQGYHMLIHPDIFKEYFTHKHITAYDFFSYEANETLLLEEEEEKQVNHLMEMAWLEFHQDKDQYSIPIILSYISTLLNLGERFYARQFDTRKKLCHQLSSNFYKLLNNYYAQSSHTEVRQPTVQYFAEKLHVTPNYLSDTLKHDSGESALNIIHHFIIEEAKKRLRNSNQTISEISYQLGFEYPNYFSRLFKQKTKLSPTEYRKSVKSI